MRERILPASTYFAYLRHSHIAEAPKELGSGRSEAQSIFTNVYDQQPWPRLARTESDGPSRAAQNAKFGVIERRTQPSATKPYIAPQIASERPLLGEEEGKGFVDCTNFRHAGL